MRNAIAAALLFVAIPAALTAQEKPRSLHIQGPQVRRLIALLVSGSNAVELSFMSRSGTRILLHDLEVMKLSTYKYDQNSAMYRLDVYSAHVHVGAADSTSLGEATALYALLSSLGIKPDGSMQGTIVGVDTVDCHIDTHLSFDKPQRFICDLALPF